MVPPSTALGVCRDVVAALDQAGLVLVGPKTHCIHHWNPEHLDNFENHNFLLWLTLSILRRLLGIVKWARQPHMKLMPHISMQQPWCLLLIRPSGSENREKRPVASRFGSRRDFVHLVPVAYHDQAAAVLKVGVELDDDNARSVVSSEGSYKRKGLESVITKPSTTTPKPVKHALGSSACGQAIWKVWCHQPQRPQPWWEWDAQRGCGAAAWHGWWTTHGQSGRGSQSGWRWYTVVTVAETVKQSIKCVVHWFFCTCFGLMVTWCLCKDGFFYFRKQGFDSEKINWVFLSLY